MNRETNSIINGRIELRRSGDIFVATNGIEQLIPRQLPFEHNGFGQDDEWVAANFTNVNEMLSVGYSQWVDDQVGVDLTNGFYKLTVTVPEKPLETTQLKVGDYSVAVTNAGEYVFLLEKGVTYPLSFYGDMDNLVYEWDDGGGGEMPTAYNLPRNRSNYSVEVSSYCDLDNPVYFNSPMDDGEGFILYHPIVTISPSYEVDPVEPLCLFAFVSDNIFSSYAEIKWIANDRVIGTGEMLFIYDLSQYSYIKVEVRHRDSLIEGSVYINRYVRDTLVNLSGGGVIITEDTYTNAPNEVVSASSTRVDLNINYQLTEVGEFKLECDDANGLEIRDETGNVVSLPLEWDGYYNEDAERVYSVTASDINATGTKTFTLTYTPYFEEEPIVRQINIDVVKIRVEAEADWPSNKVRHVFGPGERFSVFSEAGDLLSSNMASSEIGEKEVTFTLRESSVKVKIKTIPPNGVIEFEFVREMTDGDWLTLPVSKEPLTRLTPGAGFLAKRRLTPSYVNFQNIFIKEGFAPMSERVGCFADEVMFPQAEYSHNVNAGAGLICEVGMHNYIEHYDAIGVQFGTIPNRYGSYSLPIPVYWGVSRDSCNNQFAVTTQIVSVNPVIVDSDGAYLDTTVSKCGVSFTRRCPDED